MANPAALSTLRKRLGLNTKELSNLTDINPSTIAKIEKGSRTPTQRQLPVLERFGFHLEDYDEEGVGQERLNRLRLQLTDWQAQKLADARLECLQARRRYEAARKEWETHDEQLHLLQFIADQWVDLGQHKKELVRSAAFKKKWAYKGPGAEKVCQLKMEWKRWQWQVKELETNGLEI